MPDAEADAYADRPELSAILAVRAWDEAAKDPHADVPGLGAYRDMLCRHLERDALTHDQETPPMLSIELTDDHLAEWKRDHRLVIRNPFSAQALARLRAWTEEVTAWPETPGKWMKYFESSATQPRQLCRVENFIPFHAGFAELLRGAGVRKVLTALMGEAPHLFKEKINFKLPGGAGFSAHQDAPAFTSFGQRYHITWLVAIDAADADNGCLEFSDPVEVYETLPQTAGGTLAPEVEARLAWRPLPVEPGDLVFFDSYLPHRSGPNRSARGRRALYVTYNRASEGDRRDDYVEQKRLHFPPECERVPGVDYAAKQSVFNLGNPIR